MSYTEHELDFEDFNQNQTDLDIEDNETWTQPFEICKIAKVERTQEHNNCILHLDIDCFYAQVEMLNNPELRNKPIGIQQKNIIITTNYLARELGIPKSTYVADAIKKWPQLVLVNGEDLTKYRQKSYEISEFLQKYSPKVERLGFDENFIDVTDLVTWRLKDNSYKREFFGHLHKSSSSEAFCECGCYLRLQISSQIASDIREALNKELGITSSAGIAHNKLLAKLIGATHKPNQQTTILPLQSKDFMSRLSSVRCIPGVGLSIGSTLQRLGITSVVDLQRADKSLLGKEFDSSTSDFLINCSFGRDDSPVIKFELPQSMSDEDSFQCCNTFDDAERRIKGLIHSLLLRVCEDGRVPQTVRLTIRRICHGAQTWEKYRKRESRQCPVPRSIFTGIHNNLHSIDAACDLIMPILINLFKKLVNIAKPFHLTLINIGFTNLVKCTEEKSKISSYFLKSPKKAIKKLEEDSVQVQEIKFDSQKTNDESVPANEVKLDSQKLEPRDLVNSGSSQTELGNQTFLDRKVLGSFEKKIFLEIEEPKDVASSWALQDHMSNNVGFVQKCQLKSSHTFFEYPASSNDSILNTTLPCKAQVPLSKRASDCVKHPDAKCRKIMIERNCDMLDFDLGEKRILHKNDQTEEVELVNLAKALSEHNDSFIHPTQTQSTSKKIPESNSNSLSSNTKTSFNLSGGKTPDKKHQYFSPKSFQISTKVPSGIDPDVFAELPRNIQSEILAHIAMASSPKPSKTMVIGTEKKKNQPLKKGEKMKTKEQGRSSILKYFSRNT
ncbi:DNA polymerase iota-like [Biomphalaria glabrata]|uniref:DNA polymerase iota-like n=1 Tax=Biomphalaria glabrata TaxID=6526 RepID=A0A9W3AVV0_BIOGL|nr:DNA polymerase iota-like [Biomphalaria glabrata]